MKRRAKPRVARELRHRSAALREVGRVAASYCELEVGERGADRHDGGFAADQHTILRCCFVVRAGMFGPLPAVWLLHYGASFISSGSFSIRVVPVMGIFFMVLGLAACFVPLPFGNLLMGAGFGVLHIVFGFIIARSYGG